MWQIIVIFAKNKSALMKKVLLILLFAALLPFAAADAQNIALGERVPELKVPAWLDGQKPAATPPADLRRVLPVVERGLHHVAQTAPGDDGQIGYQTARGCHNAGKRGQNRPPAQTLPIAANLRGNRRRRQDLHGVRRAVRSVRGAGSIPKTGRSGREIHFN